MAVLRNTTIMREMEPLASLPRAPAALQQTLEQSIGLQVRQYRKDANLTVAELANAAGISAGMLSKIENGQISPSLSTLQTLSTALDVPIAILFSSFEQRHGCSFVRAGEGTTSRRHTTKTGHHYQLLGQTPGGNVIVEPYLVTLNYDAESFTTCRHDGVEFIFMLTGEVDYGHDGRTYNLKPGDSILFDSALPHGPERLIKAPLSFLSIVVAPRH